MEKRQTESRCPPDIYDWIPLILRNVSGFNSCVTVAVSSVLFVLTINKAALGSELGWFAWSTIAIMLSGPIIIAWHFVNVNITLSTLMETPAEEDTTTDAEKLAEVTSGVLTEKDIAMERQIFGTSITLMRAIAGFVSAHVICFISLVYTWTIHLAILAGKRPPEDVALFLVVIGPIITSWSFVRAATTLKVLVNGGGMILKIRTKLAEAIAPK